MNPQSRGWFQHADVEHYKMMAQMSYTGKEEPKDEMDMDQIREPFLILKIEDMASLEEDLCETTGGQGTLDEDVENEEPREIKTAAVSKQPAEEGDLRTEAGQQPPRRRRPGFRRIMPNLPPLKEKVTFRRVVMLKQQQY